MTFSRSVRGFGCGAAAGCAFVIVALIARSAETVPTLPELIQDRLVLAMPGPLFSLVLDRFLYLGKPLLFGSLMLGEVVLGGLGGVVIARWGRPALVALALWLLTGFVVLPIADRGVFAQRLDVAEVTFAGFVVYGIVYMLFASRAFSPAALFGPSAQPAQAAPVASIDRRRLLAGGALGLATVVLARRAIGTLPSLPPRGSSSTAAALSAGGGSAEDADALAVDPASSLPGLPPPITPVSRFYVVSKNLLDPELNASKWSLRVDGMVAQPVTLNFQDVLALPSVEEYRTLECISNEVGGDLISNGRWTGAHLADVLQKAGVQPGATQLHFVCTDNYTSTMPLSQAMDPSTLLVYQLDGAPLPTKHGYPARILGLNTYGMKNPKWVSHIEVVSTAQPGFWQQQGWDEQGIVQTMSEVVTPSDGAKLKLGTQTISGVAYAGGRGITRIEVSTDGGATWADAELLPALGPYAWAFWHYPWQAPAGSPVIAVRATDGTGTVQPARRTDPFPAGATGYHEVKVRVEA